MKKLLTAFVKYPFYGKMIIVILLVIGGISLSTLRKATFPMVESNTITVTVSYPGATPQEMEEGITTLVEDAIRGIPGIKEFSSTSMENSASVTITGESNYDIDELLSEVKNSVDGISNFPADAESPIVSKQRNTDMAMFVSLKTNTNDLHYLNDEANMIEDDFFASGCISQVSIYGIPSNKELLIEINEEQLKRYNLSLSTVQSAIASNNIDIHGGTIKNQREEIKVVSRQKSIDIEDIENIVVLTNDDGSIISVKDIANVRLDFAETPNASYEQGEQAVTIMIQKLMSEDLGEISDFVTSYVQEYNDTHENSEMQIMHNFEETIDTQLSTLINNGILGILLIVLLLSLFLNFRLSLWVAWGIPAAFLGMFILAAIFGVTLNIISLFGMILIIGILVDDGVVIGENIYTHYEKGKTPRRAAVDGALEVMPSVLTSVVTTMIAFLPLFFIEGQLKMMQDMAFVVIGVLLFSLFEAIFVLPGHLANPKVLKPSNKKTGYGRIRQLFERMIQLFKDRIYSPVLKFSIRFKALTLAVVTSLVIITFGLFASGKISFVFFPSQPADQFTIDMALKSGVNDSITKEKLFFIEEMVWEVNQELKDEFGSEQDFISTTSVNIGSSFSGAESGTNAGTVRVFLNSLENSGVSEDMIKQRINMKTNNIPDLYKYAVGATNRFGAPVSYSILAYDEEQLEEAKLLFEQELGKITSLYNVSNNSQLGSQEILLSLKPEAYINGLTNSSLMEQVRNGFYGGLVQRVQDGKDEVWVYVRYPMENRANIGQLENMNIVTQNGSFPLETMADISVGRSLNTINRYNGKREIRVDAYMKDQNENITPILEDIDDRIIPMIEEQYPEINFQKQGQQKGSAEQMGSMALYFGIAFLIIVLIIMIYFKSFGQGLLVISIIPLGIIGAVWGHLFHDNPVSMMSLWGFVALSGTVINDSIVLISKYNRNLREGMKVQDAAIDAGKSRFRAIFLTTVTTFVGLMPLILSQSQDATFLKPMAIALAYGILFGTMFILILLPMLLLTLNSIKRYYYKLRGKENVTPESVETAVINKIIDDNLETAMEEEF